MSKYVVSRKQIFLACRKHAVEKDEDSVKEFRDELSNRLFKKDEIELNDNERYRLYNFIKSRKPVNRYCSNKQSNTVRNLAFQYAVYYHDYDSISAVNNIGKPITGENLKAMIQELYKNEGWAAIPDKYRNQIWSTANTKCNSLLHKAGLRNPQKWDVFHYPSMTYQQADYLIKRFTKMNTKIAGSKKMGVPNISYN